MTVPARDAATVMLVRDAAAGDPGVEVCMVQRNLAAEFVAGAYVFPGGSVDPEDREPDAEALCAGLTDAEASERLGVERGGLALWVAALRESFEEAGLLLATGPVGDGDLLDLSELAVAERFRRHRLDLNGGRRSFLEVCRDEGLTLAVDRVHYVSHWITPEAAPKRFDTRFFVAFPPPGQEAVHDDGETIGSEWVRPADALERHARGEIDLMPPTIANLEAIGRHGSADAVVRWAAAVEEVPTILPIVRVEDGALLLLRPGDDGYDAALAERLADPERPVPDDVAALARQRFGPAGARLRPADPGGP